MKAVTASSCSNDRRNFCIRVEGCALAGEVGDGRGDSAEAFDVAAEDVGKAKEALRLFHGGGRGPVAHSNTLVSCGGSGVG